MPKNWAPASHVGAVTIGLMDVLAGEFYKEFKKGEIDHSLLIKLSQAAGYQAQLYAGLQKNIEYAARLERVEKDMHRVTPEDLALGLNPVLKEEAEDKVRNNNR